MNQHLSLDSQRLCFVYANPLLFVFGVSYLKSFGLSKDEAIQVVEATTVMMVLIFSYYI